MSKMSHTPGPWIAHPWSCSYDDPRWRVIPLGSSGGAAGLAVVHPRWYTDEVTVAANARLIAAAPELLEVLQSIIDSVDKGHAVILVPIAANARAAIAKATGGAA